MPLDNEDDDDDVEYDIAMTQNDDDELKYWNGKIFDSGTNKLKLWTSEWFIKNPQIYSYKCISSWEWQIILSSTAEISYVCGVFDCLCKWLNAAHQRYPWRYLALKLGMPCYFVMFRRQNPILYTHEHKTVVVVH